MKAKCDTTRANLIGGRLTLTMATVSSQGGDELSLVDEFSLCLCLLRGKMLLGYSDSELVNRSGYAMVHHDDLAYVASAHQEREYHPRASHVSARTVWHTLLAICLERWRSPHQLG